MIRLIQDIAAPDLTPGPWRWLTDEMADPDSCLSLESLATGRPVLSPTTDETIRVGETDSRFIARARMLIPRLVATVVVREARVRVLEKRIKVMLDEAARAQNTTLPESR